ncbi:MAG: hypothetical protein JSV42_02875 [Chloroflexota bacterium]|nr:MAG: hypothetical protein JSV42_02875 [Chloroflexota bacterium]
MNEHQRIAMVVVGVTGHRNSLDTESIPSGVDRALNKINEVFPGESLIILSPLAEGADRLVVHRAMEMFNVQLVVPLSLAVNEYMLDFNTESSRNEFAHLLDQANQVLEIPASKNREDSYLAAGLYVLDNSDVLIALWDGQPARGPGGTGQIVTKARDKKIPIAWVFACQENLPSNPAYQKKPGEVTFENFP